MIDVQNLTRNFGSFIAVSQLSFQVPDGTVLALLGQNGAGKTTTIRMLAGLLAPTSGTASVGGFDIRKNPAAVRGCVGLVTDVPGLMEEMTPIRYLDFFGSLYGMPRQQRKQKIEELLTLFELYEDRNDKLASFSKGMKQKVMIARAVLHDPAVLFLDEPTSGLDPLAARNVRDLIQKFKHSQRSIILCTHDLDEAEKLADDIVIVRQGKAILKGKPETLRADATAKTRVTIELAQPLSSATVNMSDLDGVENLTISDNGLSIHYLTTNPKIVNPQVQQYMLLLGALIVGVSSEKTSLEDVYTNAMQSNAVTTNTAVA